MSFGTKLARGLLQGASNYYGTIAQEQYDDHKADILVQRELALEALKQRAETGRAIGTAAAAADRQRDGEDLAQALRELDQLGIDPQSDDGKKYIENRTLAAQGPTATETTRRGQDITESNNVRDNAQSNRNNIRTTSTSSANNAADNATRQRGQDKEQDRFQHKPIGEGVDGSGNRVEVYPGGGTFKYPGVRPTGTASRRGASGGSGPTPPPMAPTKGARVRDRTGNFTWVADGQRWHLED